MGNDEKVLAGPFPRRLNRLQQIVVELSGHREIERRNVFNCACLRIERLAQPFNGLCNLSTVQGYVREPRIARLRHGPNESILFSGVDRDQGLPGAKRGLHGRDAGGFRIDQLGIVRESPFYFTLGIRPLLSEHVDVLAHLGDDCGQLLCRRGGQQRPEDVG